MTTLGAVALLVALLLTAAAAWWLRARDGGLRAAEGAVEEQAAAEQAAEEQDVPAPTVFERLGVRPGDADLTVVQFSTGFCAPCRATRARLQQLQARRPGLAYVDIDAEHHLEEVRELDVRRTPTLFYLRRDGTLIGRSSGAPRPDELTALVDAHAGPPAGLR